MAKKILLPLFFLLLAIPAAGVIHDRDSLLRELDKAVAQAGSYRTKYEERIAFARKELYAASGHEERLRHLRNLSHFFFMYQNDSALYYNEQAMNIAEAQADDALQVHLLCERAVLYALAGLVDHSMELLDELARDARTVTPDLRKMVYEAYFDANDYVYHYNLPGALQTKHDQTIAAIRDSFYHYSPDNTEQALHTIAAVSSSKEIIEKLINRLDNAQSDMERATLAMVISNRYQSEAMSDLREIYLILAAIYHIRAARLDNEALVKLGKIMLDDEDWDRAEAYLSLAHEQALEYGSRSREVQLSPMLYRLQEHLTERAETWRTVVWVACSAILLLIISAMTQWYLTKKHSRRLKCAMASLKDTNAHAAARESASQVRAEAQADALTHFMGIATDATFEFVHLKHLVVRKLKNNDGAALLKQLTAGGGTSKTQTELLRKFDIAFTRLYPDFIAQVNALMQPDTQINKPENEFLSTELRLLALWRLGLTEAGRVATILNLSVNTIYFYRNKLRAGAIDRDHFNDAIMAIKGV